MTGATLNLPLTSVLLTTLFLGFGGLTLLPGVVVSDVTPARVWPHL
jgi:hypothetical protein